MELSNYILALLPEHDTVVIPGLGAFVANYRPAQVNERTGEMKPPSKVVSFEKKIRNNDGLLAGKISQEDGISLSEAYQKLELEREEILFQLDKGEKVKLTDLGELWYDKNNELRFTSSGKDILSLDSYGLAPGTLKKDSKNEPKQKVKPVITAKGKETSDPFKERKAARYSGATLKYSGSTPEKSNKAWWLLLFLIPVIAGAIYIFSGNSETVPPTEETQRTEPMRQEALPHTDTVATDTTPSEEESSESVINEVPDTIVFVSPDTTKYYLISGSFEDYENAQKFVVRLKREGYEPFHLGKQGSFYLVGINIFDNSIEAYGQQYNYLDKYPESGAWVYAPGKN